MPRNVAAPPLLDAQRVVQEMEHDYTVDAQEAMLEANVRLMAEKAGVPLEIFRRLPVDMQVAFEDEGGPGYEASETLRNSIRRLGARIGTLQNLTGSGLNWDIRSGRVGTQDEDEFQELARGLLRNDELKHFIPMLRKPVLFRGEYYHPRTLSKVARDPEAIREAYKAGFRTSPEVPLMPKPDVPCALGAYVIGGCSTHAYTQADIEVHMMIKHPTAYRAWTDSRNRELQQAEIDDRRTTNKVMLALLEKMAGQEGGGDAGNQSSPAVSG